VLPDWRKPLLLQLAVFGLIGATLPPKSPPDSPIRASHIRAEPSEVARRGAPTALQARNRLTPEAIQGAEHDRLDRKHNLRPDRTIVLRLLSFCSRRALFVAGDPTCLATICKNWSFGL
jgi:hypothetical protein